MLLSKKEQYKTPLQTVIEDLKDGFCTVEQDGGFIYVNRVAVVALGSPIREYVNAVDRRRLFQIDLQPGGIRVGLPTGCEVVRHAVDGEPGRVTFQ